MIANSNDYYGNHVYRDRVLERITNDYGYWAGGNWYYHVKDYQGNVRAVIDGQGTLEEVNNYYPYGALMGGGTVNNPGIQPYKYGTKELDRQNGLDWYDADGERDKRTVPVSHSVYRKKQNNTIVDITPSNTSKQIHVVPLNVFEKIRKRIEVGSSTGEIK